MALPSCLQYKNVNSESYSKSFCKDVTGTLAFNWMLNGQFGQNVQILPTYFQQVVKASSKNRYLASVTVAAIPALRGTIPLAAAAEATLTIPGAYSVSSSNTAYATATVASQVVTITGVAAGTATITVLDRNNKTAAVLTITVA